MLTLLAAILPILVGAILAAGQRTLAAAWRIMGRRHLPD